MSHLPMLASPTNASANRPGEDCVQLMSTGDWIADLKMDGTRAFAHWTGTTLTLLNRSGVNVTRKYPELTEAAERTFASPVLLDGEIVALDGSFETTLVRDKQDRSAGIAAMARQHPVGFFAFDLPTTKPTPYVERRAELEALEKSWPVGPYKITPISEDPEYFSHVAAMGLEGIIVKRKTSRYQFGSRSKDWKKFKTTHRVTCLVAGYTTGTGSRSHFGAMHLAMLDETGTPVSVGRVGTGFTEKEITFLKIALDRGDLLIVEIEALNVTSGGQLRFPVYKHIRTDVGPEAAALAQLESLPTC